MRAKAKSKATTAPERAALSAALRKLQADVRKLVDRFTESHGSAPEFRKHRGKVGKALGDLLLVDVAGCLKATAES